ncbi:MAG TPA: NPCBM/NEW2 domain-containing protein, partial [Verrucomicrobiae bacterium]|nr:NPCBM/NEW2 domain-containing protein [Verrucomicrobiae bacterium]
MNALESVAAATALPAHYKLYPAPPLVGEMPALPGSLSLWTNRPTFGSFDAPFSKSFMKLHTSRFRKLHLTLLLALAVGAARAEQTYWLNQVNPAMVEFDTDGRARIDHSTMNHDLSIAGQSFTNGLGTRAQSQLILDLQGKAHSFYGKVGIDDEVPKGNGSVVFKLIGDNKKVLWQSPVMHSGDAAQEVNVALKGVKMLTLIADDNNDGNRGDDADWVDVKIVTDVEPVAKLAPHEPAVVLTPKPARTPRINSAKVFGVRPEHPF